MIPIQDVVPTGRVPVATLSCMAGAVVGFVLQLQQPPAPLLAPFSHASTPHFVLNVLFLWLFGDNVEARLGKVTFVALFAACGWLPYYLVPELSPALGAASAVSGILGAYFALLPRSRILVLVPFPLSLVEVPAVFFLVVWVLFYAVGLALTPDVSVMRIDTLSAMWTLAAAWLGGAAAARLKRRPIRW